MRSVGCMRRCTVQYYMCTVRDVVLEITLQKSGHRF